MCYDKKIRRTTDMINVVIAEDDPSSAKTLSLYVKKFAQENNREIRITTYRNGEELIKNHTQDTDIILLDIDMPELDGMTAARKIRATDKNVIIIFVTNLASYAVNGYEVEAFDFVVKPVSYYQFSLKMKRAAERIDSANGKVVWIINRDGRYAVKTNNIIFAEIQKHIMTLHTTEGDFTTRNGTLKGLQDELIGLPFASPMQCYLVNLRYVTGVEKKDVVVGKYRLGISSAKRRAFLTALSDYLGKGYLSGTEEDDD